MNIKILHLIDGAKKATGITVIIDVFRAFTVESYLIKNGAERVVPIAEKETAYKCRDDNPEIILIGERHGKILDGFDYGNSPSQIENVSFVGKTAVHTTSAGTQGIANAKQADEILVAGLVNAKATAEYIKAKNPDEVSLVCMGLEGKKQTDEDNLCAEYIKSILENQPIEMKERTESLKLTSGAKFFDKFLQDVFPQKDFFLCTDVDRFDFALKYEKGDKDEFGHIVKM